jgi:hypothetical protein
MIVLERKQIIAALRYDLCRNLLLTIQSIPHSQCSLGCPVVQVVREQQ